VKGGWRIYSSGPGLYLHRIVHGVLGVRDSFGDIVFDPVLPRALDGLVAAIERDGRRIEIRYSVGSLGYGVRRLRLNRRELPLDRREQNPYRQGGARVATSLFNEKLRQGLPSASSVRLLKLFPNEGPRCDLNSIATTR
jgi:1,2-beta-oligoglucan phosphorylase